MAVSLIDLWNRLRIVFTFFILFILICWPLNSCYTFNCNCLPSTSDPKKKSYSFFCDFIIWVYTYFDLYFVLLFWLTSKRDSKKKTSKQRKTKLATTTKFVVCYFSLYEFRILGFSHLLKISIRNVLIFFIVFGILTN